MKQFNCIELNTLFIDHMRSFGDRLGTSFLQLSDSFGPDRAGLLQEYVRMLPEDLSTCVELRHADWFHHGTVSPRVADVWRVFRERGIGTVITDTAGRRDDLHPADYTRIDARADRIKVWMEELNTPERCKYAVERISKTCGTLTLFG